MATSRRMTRSVARATVVVATLALHACVVAQNVSINAVGKGSFDCKHLKADSYSFDLSTINFPVTIERTEKTPPTTTKTLIAINLCAPLQLEAGPAEEQCPQGTRICMRVVNEKKGDGDRVTQVIPAGGSTRDEMDWSTQLGERLLGTERALELEMHGEYYGDRRQQTEINLRCDKQASKDSVPVMKKYDPLDGKLKLEWTTPHACATHIGDSSGGGGGDSNDEQGDGDRTNDGSKKAGWGIFSWFFFLVFVGGIVYLGAGLWRNYNEYGVIELPNKDFWREAPYIAKDVGKHIYSTVSGQGSSRGAYEPV